ncbi:MAG TPA: protein-glutamate O-methyltransferase CheR, partial [Desulfopila sp.]|nr:protein-glutamate O-methyltransferase CheR [Desulfopila sp.]
MLQEHGNIDFSEYKETTILRRIKRRMVINKMEDLKEYVAHITSNPEELTSLRKDLLISVTSFFRDSQAFEALTEQLKEQLSKKQPGDSFRAWVPGCATGEEAYSIAILVAEILGKHRGKYHVQIFATDIDEDAIQLARKGIYPVATLMETDGRRFEQHFDHIDDTVKLKKHIRDMVVFARQDVTGDTPFLHLDLISCRNLMIYMNPGLQDKVLSLFQFSLNQRGLLFLGKSESINKHDNLFKPVDSRWKIYRRQESGRAHMPKLVQKRHMDQLIRHRDNFGKQQRDDREK